MSTTESETPGAEATPRGGGGRVVYLDLLRAALVALVISHHAAVANGAQGGWYYVLPANEKVLSTADVFSNVIYFTTYKPETANVCDAVTGRAKLYALDMSEGLPGFDWVLGEPLPTPDVSPDVWLSQKQADTVASLYPTSPPT